MTIPQITTRSIAQISLLVSVIALILTLAHPPAGGWSVSHAPVPTALAAAPKTALAGSLLNSDPASARAYYIAQRPEDLATYTHPVYWFLFSYPRDFTVHEIKEGEGELVLVENPAMGMGFQLFIMPDDESGPLTAARIQRDLPDMPMDETVEFMLSDETAAVRFVTQDPVLGDVAETWFRREGYLFQLSVVAPDRELQDAWVREFANTLTFADDALRPRVAPPRSPVHVRTLPIVLHPFRAGKRRGKRMVCTPRPERSRAGIVNGGCALQEHRSRLQCSWASWQVSV